jgi:hypothetical protein
MNWFIWRPVFEKRATIAEIRNHYTLVDLVHIHSIMDMEADIKWIEESNKKP